jgi:hypothetical protein
MDSSTGYLMPYDGAFEILHDPLFNFIRFREYEDFISIDINKLLDKALTKKKVKADYFNSIKTSDNPLFTQLEESLSKNNIQSVTIKTNDKDYLIDEVFFTKDGKEARTLTNMLQYGKVIENKNAGKSTYQITNQKKIKKE